MQTNLETITNVAFSNAELGQSSEPKNTVKPYLAPVVLTVSFEQDGTTYTGMVPARALGDGAGNWAVSLTPGKLPSMYLFGVDGTPLDESLDTSLAIATAISANGAPIEREGRGMDSDTLAKLGITATAKVKVDTEESILLGTYAANGVADSRIVHDAISAAYSTLSTYLTTHKLTKAGFKKLPATRPVPAWLGKYAPAQTTSKGKQ